MKAWFCLKAAIFIICNIFLKLINRFLSVSIEYKPKAVLTLEHLQQQTQKEIIQEAAYGVATL